jgi:hypothetical protein
MLLVGDNPFHGISHLSQDRVRARGESITRAEHAAEVVKTALANGSEGFMFSVSDTTLSILRLLRGEYSGNQFILCPIIPYAYSYVRSAVQTGGTTGLAKQFIKNVLLSLNFSAAYYALKGIVRSDPIGLLQSLVSFEISRVKSSVGKAGRIYCVYLHEILTDMAIALDLKGMVTSYIDTVSKYDGGGSKILAGFETRNFPMLVKKLKEWGIDLHTISITAPFNSVGFQMSPGKEACETTLKLNPELNVIAMSIMAAGFLSLKDAVRYIDSLEGLKGIVLGVSSVSHARESFQYLNETFSSQLSLGLEGQTPHLSL